MVTNSILQSGLQGIQSNLTGLQQTAQKIATAGTEANPISPGSVAESLVELKLYEMGTAASAKVVKSADEVLGTLLNTFA